MKKIPGISIKQVSRDQYWIKKQIENNKRRGNNDTVLRTELQSRIAALVNQGKNKEEVISELKKNDRFLSFEQYFDGYVQNHINKRDKQKNKVEIDEEER